MGYSVLSFVNTAFFLVSLVHNQQPLCRANSVAWLYLTAVPLFSFRLQERRHARNGFSHSDSSGQCAMSWEKCSLQAVPAMSYLVPHHLHSGWITRAFAGTFPPASQSSGSPECRTFPGSQTTLSMWHHFLSLGTDNSMCVSKLGLLQCLCTPQDWAWQLWCTGGMVLWDLCSDNCLAPLCNVPLPTADVSVPLRCILDPHQKVSQRANWTGGPLDGTAGEAERVKCMSGGHHPHSQIRDLLESRTKVRAKFLWNTHDNISKIYAMLSSSVS